MKKMIICLTIILMLVSICACGKIADEVSEAMEESGAINGGVSDTASGLPSGFPETVPLHSRADIVESSKGTADGVVSYYVNMRFEGEIEQLSDWYKQELAENWQVDSVSSGDYDDWAEFYVDAQDCEYYLSVYLYQDTGSSYVSVDINAEGKIETAGETRDEEEAGEEEEAVEDEAEGSSVTYSGELEDAKIAFVCASVGSNWNIGDHFPGLDITVCDEYQFDKGNVVRDILERDRPDIMIIKECAAYFPPEDYETSMEAYQDLIRDWVNLCRGDGVIPVLTTVVPVDPDNPENPPGRLDSILEFNDWIREYCDYEEISVLDLEASLRISEDDRALDPDYDSGDGLHPNDLAYTEELDDILIPALEEALDIGY
jgi:hypothetical protein